MAADRSRKIRRARATEWGFTLAEILTAVAVVALISAIVIPALYDQFTKGQAGRIGNDLLTVRTAIDNFYKDVGRYPSSVGQLTNAPAAVSTSQPPLVGPFYTAREVSRWRGPYLALDSVAALLTGSNFSIAPAFDSVTLAATGPARAAGGVKYMIVYVVSADTTTAVLVDNAIDDGNTQSGLIRWQKKGATGTDTLKLLAAPIVP